jgi:hypothetical protein
MILCAVLGGLLMCGTAVHAEDDRESDGPQRNDNGSAIVIPDAPSRGPLALPRPAVDHRDRATVGDPAPRVYGQRPTLGDPRSHRRTSPLYCAGLLCD